MTYTFMSQRYLKEFAFVEIDGMFVVYFDGAEIAKAKSETGAHIKIVEHLMYLNANSK